MLLRLFIISWIVIVLLSLLIFDTQAHYTSVKKLTECERKCHGNDGEMMMTKLGQTVCIDHKKGPFVSVPCYVKCLGETIAKNQQDCYCEVCKNGKDEDQPDVQGEFFNFCTGQGEGPLKSRDECLDTVCIGQGGYKYFGDWCDPDFG